MSIRDEDLIDYLLDEGDAELIRRVEAALQADPRVARRLQDLRAAMGMLDSLQASIEPPSGLVSRTLNFIDAHAAESGAPEESGRPKQNYVQLRPSDVTLENRSRRTAWDSAFLTVSVAAMACLMLPLMLQGRSISRQNQCANHLRFLGQSVTHLAMLDREHRFPAIPGSGSEGFAARYVLKLRDCDLLDSSSWLRCVSVPGTDTAEPRTFCIPTTREFLEASALQQVLWRNELGGDYAYNFGLFEGGRIVGPKLEGRTHYAILADAPRIKGDREVFYAHEGRGINLFYQDGHVRFCKFPNSWTGSDQDSQWSTEESGSSLKSIVRAANWSSAQDYPFRNLAGQHAHGLDANDAALGPSASEPRLK